MHSFLADVLVFVHLLYVSYVFFGQLAIVAAGTFKWEWGRNRWFRVTHLLAIAVVAVEAAVGYECPLTTWERELRITAGQTVDERGFVARLMHDIVFLGDRYQHKESITVGFIAFFFLVVQGFLMYPPRSRRERPAAVPAREETPAPRPQPVPQPAMG